MYKISELHQYSKELNILYVEDDKIIAAETVSFLEDFFLSVTSAYNGEEGVKLYDQYKQESGKYFDLVITDINMPKKNGLEMIKELKAMNKYQTVLVISAYNESSDLIQLIDAGIANFVMKPINQNKFIHILYTICKNIINEKQREQLFISQSKLASMGQMIENIAHQWKQPLAQINSIILSLDFDLEEHGCKSKVVEERLVEIETMTKYMGRTISDFQHYYQPNKKTTVFSLSEVISDAMVILNSSTEFRKIEVDIDVDMTFMLEGVKNELQQVILIVLNNSKEIFTQRDIKNPEIKIQVNEIDGYYKILISDNGGGIEEEILEKVFQLYFTTKSNSKGTGLGLYISKSMIETHFDGQMSIRNNDVGASVEIFLSGKIK